MAGAGANWRLPQLVGIGVARRMLYTGLRLGARNALAAGLAAQALLFDSQDKHDRMTAFLERRTR